MATTSAVLLSGSISRQYQVRIAARMAIQKALLLPHLVAASLRSFLVAEELEALSLCVWGALKVVKPISLWRVSIMLCAQS